MITKKEKNGNNLKKQLKLIEFEDEKHTVRKTSYVNFLILINRKKNKLLKKCKKNNPNTEKLEKKWCNWKKQ